MIWIVVAIVVAVVVLVVLVLALRRRRGDGVDEFRRHIGALSPEARRPVVDRVQQLDESTDRDPDQGAMHNVRDAASAPSDRRARGA